MVASTVEEAWQMAACEEAGISMENIGRLEGKIDTVVLSVSDIKTSLSRLETLHFEMEKWKVEVNMRLAQGVDRMIHIDKKSSDAKDAAEELKKAVSVEINTKIEAAIKTEKRVVLAYLLGAGTVGGGVVAGAMKLLGL